MLEDITIMDSLPPPGRDQLPTRNEGKQYIVVNCSGASDPGGSAVKDSRYRPEAVLFAHGRRGG